MMMVVKIIIISWHFQFCPRSRNSCYFFVVSQAQSLCWGLERSLLSNSLALFLSLFYVVHEFDKFAQRAEDGSNFQFLFFFPFFFVQETAFIWILVWKMESFQTAK